jgi:hypothetical protein
LSGNDKKRGLRVALKGLAAYRQMFSKVFDASQNQPLGKILQMA